MIWLTMVAIATLRNVEKGHRIIGYRVLQLENTSYTDLQLQKVKKLFTMGYKVHNLKISNDRIVPQKQKFDLHKFPSILARKDASDNPIVAENYEETMSNPRSYTLLRRFYRDSEDGNDKYFYLMSDYKGTIYEIASTSLMNQVEKGLVWMQNAEIVKRVGVNSRSINPYEEYLPSNLQRDVTKTHMELVKRQISWEDTFGIKKRTKDFKTDEMVFTIQKAKLLGLGVDNVIYRTLKAGQERAYTQEYRRDRIDTLEIPELDKSKWFDVPVPRTQTIKHLMEFLSRENRWFDLDAVYCQIKEITLLNYITQMFEASRQLIQLMNSENLNDYTDSLYKDFKNCGTVIADKSCVLRLPYTNKKNGCTEEFYILVTNRYDRIKNVYIRIDMIMDIKFNIVWAGVVPIQQFVVEQASINIPFSLDTVSQFNVGDYLQNQVEKAVICGNPFQTNDIYKAIGVMLTFLKTAAIEIHSADVDFSKVMKNLNHKYDKDFVQYFLIPYADKIIEIKTNIVNGITSDDVLNYAVQASGSVINIMSISEVKRNKLLIYQDYQLWSKGYKNQAAKGLKQIFQLLSNPPLKKQVPIKVWQIAHRYRDKLSRDFTLADIDFSDWIELMNQEFIEPIDSDTVEDLISQNGGTTLVAVKTPICYGQKELQTIQLPKGPMPKRLQLKKSGQYTSQFYCDDNKNTRVIYILRISDNDVLYGYQLYQIRNIGNALSRVCTSYLYSLKQFGKSFDGNDFRYRMIQSRLHDIDVVAFGQPAYNREDVIISENVTRWLQVPYDYYYSMDLGDNSFTFQVQRNKNRAQYEISVIVQMLNGCAYLMAGGDRRYTTGTSATVLMPVETLEKGLELIKLLNDTYKQGKLTENKLNTLARCLANEDFDFGSFDADNWIEQKSKPGLRARMVEFSDLIHNKETNRLKYRQALQLGSCIYSYIAINNNDLIKDIMKIKGIKDWGGFQL